MKTVTMDLKTILEMKACRISIWMTSHVCIDHSEKLLHHYVLTYQGLSQIFCSHTKESCNNVYTVTITVSYVVHSSIKEEAQCCEGYDHLSIFEQNISQISPFLYEQAPIMMLVS